MEQKRRLEGLYSAKEETPSLHFSISSQHYPFAVDGFLRFLRDCNPPQYVLHMIETDMYQVIEDVYQSRSEIGVIFLSNLTETFIKKVLKSKGLVFHQLQSLLPHVYVGAAFTFLAGFQSCLFRKWEGTAHNTIVSTGNLRSIGLYLYDALDKNQNQEWSKLARYVMVAFSFAVGCAVGALVCTQMGIRASWLGSVIAITMALTLHQREKACVNL